MSMQETSIFVSFLELNVLIHYFSTFQDHHCWESVHREKHIAGGYLRGCHQPTKRAWDGYQEPSAALAPQQRPTWGDVLLHGGKAGVQIGGCLVDDKKMHLSVQFPHLNVSSMML